MFPRLQIENPKKKRGTLDRLVFADPSKTATFNASFLEHVAWAFRMTSDLRNKIAGRGVAITRVRHERTARAHAHCSGPTGLDTD